jgi:hypothetical protein
MVVPERKGLTARNLVVRRWAVATTLFALAATASGQQPATQTAPIHAINTKYVNGVAPVYWPTAGSGLTPNISAGTAFCGGSIQTCARGTLTMAASSTDYVYLDTPPRAESRSFT